MSINTLTDEGNEFVKNLISEHQRSIWNAAIESAATAVYDSEHVWSDSDAILDGAKQRVLDLRR